MKNLKDATKLTREQMKQVVAGTNKTNKTWWACYDSTYGDFLANVCSLTNPDLPQNNCSGMTCTNLGTSCAQQFLCP